MRSLKTAWVAGVFIVAGIAGAQMPRPSQISQDSAAVQGDTSHPDYRRKVYLRNVMRPMLHGFATRAVLLETCGATQKQHEELSAYMAATAPALAALALELYPAELDAQRRHLQTLQVGCGTPQHQARLKQADNAIRAWKDTAPHLEAQLARQPSPARAASPVPSSPVAPTPVPPRPTQPAEARQRVQDIARLHAAKALTLEACSPGKAREIRAELEGLIKGWQLGLVPAALEVFDEESASGAERLEAIRAMCGSPLYANRLMNDSHNVEVARRTYGAPTAQVVAPVAPNVATSAGPSHASDPRYRSFAPEVRRLIDEEAEAIPRMCGGTPVGGPYDCNCYTRQLLEARMQSRPSLSFGAPSPSGTSAAVLQPALADLVRTTQLAQCISKPLILRWAQTKTAEALRLQPNLDAAAVGSCTGEQFYARFAARPAPDGNYINHLFSEVQFECLAKLRRR